MKEIAVVYWSGSGNTEQMAHDLCRGIEDAGCLPRLYRAAEFQETMMAQYENIAFGCPAMGFEELEPSEFEPMFQAVEPYLPGKKVALFGSYGWGEGQWMEDWAAAVQKDGAVLVDRPVISCEEPGEEERIECETLGATLALA
ncbi:MAG TPA: flavodoxin domain-containing protein [Firmicutes bacterium]|nr:flavodoxin domain-containing protein [Bacillota bacterium]